MKLGGRFSRKAPTPSAKSAVATEACCSSRLERQLLLERCGARVVEQLLRHPDRLRRHRGPRGCDLRHPRLEARRPGSPRRRAPRRVPRLHRACGSSTSTRTRARTRAGGGGTRCRRSRARGRCRRSRGRTPPRSTRRGRRRRLASESPAPATGPLTAAMTGLASAADQPDVRVVGRLERILQRLLQLRELAEILAGREAATRAGDHDGAHGRIAQPPRAPTGAPRATPG